MAIGRQEKGQAGLLGRKNKEEEKSSLRKEGREKEGEREGHAQCQKPGRHQSARNREALTDTQKYQR